MRGFSIKVTNIFLSLSITVEKRNDTFSEYSLNRRIDYSERIFLFSRENDQEMTFFGEGYVSARFIEN